MFEPTLAQRGEEFLVIKHEKNINCNLIHLTCSGKCEKYSISKIRKLKLKKIYERA